MAGIAGIASHGKNEQVQQMLTKISHRGRDGEKLLQHNGLTLGAVWPSVQAVSTSLLLRNEAAWDGTLPPLPDPLALPQNWDPFAMAAATPQGIFLARDPMGVRPLYYGNIEDGALCFASEVKSLLEVTRDVHEFPPGTYYQPSQGFQPFSSFKLDDPLSDDPEQIAHDLRLRLEQAVTRRIDGDVMGSWLSGGLDSSAIAALARPHLRELHTFSVGLADAPDLHFARQVADALDTRHYEMVVKLEHLLAALPDVIYHLESFDALLVRSTMVNYLVGREAAQHVGAVFSGEGGDELFAGYAYLENVLPERLADELLEITGRLHNTALQRVDRSAFAHGLVPRLPFLDADVVRYVMRIPPALKLQRQDRAVEKWILRQALAGLLPESVLWRRKAKFWEGSGVGDLLSDYANARVTDADFARQRKLSNGWVLNTKEELLYYRIFQEWFGEFNDLSWMGRTKGAPRQ